jgi:hypothetical protein
MKYFCSKCGKTTQYNFEMPKFCAFCGQSFGNQPASIQADNSRNKFLNELKSKKINELNKLQFNDIEENIEEDFTNIDFKNIKAKYSLNIYNPKGDSFKDLIDNPSKPPEQNDMSRTNQSRTREEILAEFQNEASSFRQK